MSNIVEEYTAKRYAEGIQLGERRGEIRGERKGIRKGEQKTLLNSIKTLMQTMHFSATEAMDALRVDEAKRSQYMALL